MNMSIRIDITIAPHIKIDLLPDFSTVKYKGKHSSAKKIFRTPASRDTRLGFAPTWLRMPTRSFPFIL
jgi:hypothetical protein